MTTPNTYTFLNGLLAGQASLVVSAGVGLTISADTWGNASTSTPLIVLCDQACTITLPSAGPGKTAQTQIVVVKTGTGSYTVDIARNGGLINGAATDDQFTGTDTGIYRYNSDATDWFRELGGGGAGDMQGAYDGGPDITGATDLTWDLTGADIDITADKQQHAGITSAFRGEIVPFSGGEGEASSGGGTVSVFVDTGSTAILPTTSDLVTTYSIVVTCCENSGTPDVYRGTFDFLWDGAALVEVSPLLDLRDFASVDYSVTVTLGSGSADTIKIETTNDSGANVGVKVFVLAYEHDYIEAGP